MHKGRWAIVACLMFVAFCAGRITPGPMPGELVIEAQTLPITKTLLWSASIVDATHAAPDGYVVSVDGVAAPAVTGTTAQVTFTAVGPHTISVMAINLWGQSDPATLPVVVQLPAKPTSLFIR